MNAVSHIDRSEPRRTDPKSFIVSTLSAVPRMVLPILAGFYGIAQGGKAWGLAVLALFALGGIAISVLVAFLQWRRFTYRVGEADIRVESGVLSRAARSVPYERIQDVSLEQGPVARIFDLVQVKFETGAGGKDELALAYLRASEGEALRELVRERREGEVASAETEDALTPATAESSGDANANAQTLFAMGPRRIFTFGLFEFSLTVVAAAAGAAQQFDQFISFDIWDVDTWQRLLTGPGERLLHIGLAWQVIAAIGAIVSLAAIGLVTGLVRTALREWDFRLDKTPRGFRRRRGLLTRTDLVMPVHRVQALSFTTGIIRRRFGWGGLSFISLAQDSGKGNHSVAPFAKDEELEPIVRAAQFASPDASTEWHRSSTAYHAVRALMESLLLVPVTIGTALGIALAGDGGAIVGGWALLLAPVALWGFLMVRRYMLWRHHRHALDHRQVYRRTGWLAPKLLVGSRIKQQSVEIAQGPLARRYGYATLALGLAGGKFDLHGVPVAEAYRMRGAILSSIAGTDFSELL
ncbi:PH domain-containing protein [Erythrobacter sp. LQ02-29]|uniref:PH domain-containing protein n=1 Tax=Erythrobacter sp. LQ02-29 TaxID=2920384 RepID=UPI001F4D5BDD|nr:PH domain-containing protein [Erythrobacter sp. LQ02-29]